MKICDIVGALGAKVICGAADGEYSGVYVGDLLSRAMSHVKAGDLWVTIMVNTNVVAVASLTECAAVLLAEGVELMPDALSAAEENGIVVLSSDRSVYDICTVIHSLEDGQA